MSHPHHTLCLLALASLLATASCGKKDEGADADAGAVSASAAPVAADDAGAAATPPPPPKPTVTAPPRVAESMDACCSALTAAKSSAKDVTAKRRVEAAAAVCPGIARLVKEGKTSRRDGLTQIKSALGAHAAPGECN